MRSRESQIAGGAFVNRAIWGLDAAFDRGDACSRVRVERRSLERARVSPVMTRGLRISFPAVQRNFVVGG
jgi:hypothetical protein